MPLPVSNSPGRPLLAGFAVQNSPCSLEISLFGTFCACRANFIPLSSARSRAGRTLYRMRGRDGASHHSTPRPTSVEGAEGLAVVPVGDGGARLGFKPTRPATHQRHSTTGVEGAGGAGGPGCGARGRWRGLAGLRDDAPSEARGADDSRAGRRPRAQPAARPDRARQRPEHPWGHKQSPHGTYPAHQALPGTQRQHTAKGPKRRSASGPSRVSVAHRLSWMLRPGTASISSRV